METGNFYRLIRDNRILFLKIFLLNGSPHFIRLLLELLNLIFEKVCFSRTINRLKEACMYMFMALATSLVVLFY